MSVPKKRRSLSKRGMRQSHDRLFPSYTIQCQNCGTPHLRHRVCPNCGQYRGKQVGPVPADSSVS